MTQRKAEQINRRRRFGPGELRSRGAVRTRGFVPVSPPSETEGASVRTRGAVRTRGPTVKVEPWQELKPEELGEVLEQLRAAQAGFPITVIVENPQALEAQSFLECLRNGNLLGTNDVLWVMGEGGYEGAVPEGLQGFVPEDAYLNAQEEKHKTLAATLVADLVFVSDAESDELQKRLEKWERRVWAVILAGPDDFDPPALDLVLGIPGEYGDRWRRRWAKG